MPITIEDIARSCHMANRELCEAVGDHSQLPWDQAAQWQRDGMIKGVKFRLANPLAPLSALHDAWCADKTKEGWVYGEVKDAEKKTHPCLVPHENLPPHQVAKDAVFSGIVESLKGLLDPADHPKLPYQKMTFYNAFIVMPADTYDQAGPSACEFSKSVEAAGGVMLLTPRYTMEPNIGGMDFDLRGLENRFVEALQGCLRDMHVELNCTRPVGFRLKQFKVIQEH